MLPSEVQQLRLENERYKAQLDNYQALIGNIAGVVYQCAMDEHWTMFYISDYIEQLSGYPASDFIGNKVRSYSSIMHGNESIHTDPVIIKAVAEGDSFLVEYRIMTASGKEVWVFEKGQAEYDTEGNPVCLNGLIIPIDDRNKARNSLRRAELQNRLILDIVKEGIFGVNAEGICTFMNPAGLSILGYTVNEIVSQPVDQFIPDELDDVGECVLVRKNGEPFYAEYAVSTTDNREVLADKFVSFRDISERKQAEKQLQASRAAAELANRAKSSFLANMSHELRTPLNAILGFSEVLRSIEQEATKQQHLDAINTAGKVLLALINDVLDLSKIEAGKLDLQPVPLSLRDLCEEMLVLFRLKAANKGLMFKYYVDENLPPLLLLDGMRLRQVLTNICNNAVKFTDHGHVHIHISAKSQRVDDLDLIIAIEDTGKGIKPNQHQKIFTAFQQADGQLSHEYGGTGLGLSISKHLIEAMGGQVSVRSQPGAGSTFILDLPGVPIYSEQLVTKTGFAEVVIDTKFEPAKILLVDDVASNRQLICAYLSGSSFTIIEAKNGVQALEKAESEGPDLILLDMKMPVMDGYEVSERLKLKALTRDIPIIAITASAFKAEEATIRQYCQDYLAKPVSKSALIKVLKDYLPHSDAVSNALPVDNACQPMEMASAELPDCSQLQVLVAEDNVVNKHVISVLLSRFKLQPMISSDGVEVVDAYQSCIEQGGRVDLILMDCDMPNMNGYQASEAIRRYEKNRNIEPTTIYALSAFNFAEHGQRCLIAGMNGCLIKPVNLKDIAKVLSNVSEAS